MAQVSGAGSTSTNFLKIGMGARAAAMGDSFAGVANDSTAVFWNPAGLVMARGTQFSLTHGEWLLGVTHEFFSFSQNIDQDGAFGGSFGYLGSGTFQGAGETADPTAPGGSDYVPGSMISANNFTGTIAYAQRLGNWFPGDFFKRSLVGVSANVVGQNVVNVGNAGLSFDVGYMYEIIHKTCFATFVVRDLGTDIQGFSEPLNFVLGGSYQFHNLLMKKDQNILSAEGDGYIDNLIPPQNSQGVSVNLRGLVYKLGDEYRMTVGRNDVAVRVGFSTEDDLSGFTTGVGIAHRFDDFQAGLDYAYVPYGLLGDTHRISVNVIIGGDMVKPEAYVNAGPAFILGQQTVNVNFATKSEEPIDSYKVNIVDSSGMLVKTFAGKGNPPSHFLWDGRNQAGELVPQGNYTFTLHVADDNDLEGDARPAQTYAKWVPKRVPYQYSFQVSGDLLFDSGKDELLQRGYDAVQKAALAIRKRYPDSIIIIAGHTDNQKVAKTSKFKDNQELSLARAKAVMAYLVKNGMDPSKLSVVGYGETKPIATNDTKEGRAKNRRVELVVSGVMDATATDLIGEGMIQFNNQNYREALDRFLKAIESDSRNAKAYHLAGDCYLRLGGKDMAIAAYQKSLKYNPNDMALRQWMNQYGPKTAPAPLPGAPVSNTPPALPNAAVPPAQPGTQANPVTTAPATQPQTAPPAGVPQPVN